EIKTAKKGDKVILEISSKTGKAVARSNEVYLTTDQRLLETLQRTKEQGLPVDIEVNAEVGQKLKVRMSSGDLIVEVVDDFEVQEARKAPTSKEQIITAMEKLGDTSFTASSVDVKVSGDIFIPIGVLTGARREAAEMLLGKLLGKYRKKERHPLLSDIPHFCGDQGCDSILRTPVLSVEVKNPDTLFDAVQMGADIVYVPFRKFHELTSEQNRDQLEAARKSSEIVLLLPRISHEAELMQLLPLLEKVKDAGFRIACYTLGQVEVAKQMEIPFVVQKEFNTFNSYTADEFYKAGAYRVTLSSELNLDEIRDVCDEISCRNNECQLEILVHGRELMLITEHDLLKPLLEQGIASDGSEVLMVDSKGIEYPVKRVEERTLIYDSKVLDMSDKIEQLKKSGVDVIRLDLSMYGKRDVQEITSAYRRILDGKPVELRPRRGIKFSRGHYFKGV
ncbi:MAG: DUF3656 domain-containing U32 family peptidase, partial [Halobacteriota archaeon]